MNARFFAMLLLAAVATVAMASLFRRAPSATSPAAQEMSQVTITPASGAAAAVQGHPTPANQAPASNAEAHSGPSSLAAVKDARDASLERRIVALESQVRVLQEVLSGVSLEKASTERQALFAADEGYLKADEYAAAGQHAIAGEGYLTFLQHHPQHPDARDVMKKSRDSFLKAGYKDKAFWVQEEMMKANPQHQLADLEELAHIEKDAGLYDRAMQHMDQAAQLDPNAESRLWKRLYSAWFVQMHQGNAAGLEALKRVQQEIVTSGVDNPKLNERLQRHTTEWGRQLGYGQ